MDLSIHVTFLTNQSTLIKHTAAMLYFVYNIGSRIGAKRMSWRFDVLLTGRGQLLRKAWRDRKTDPHLRHVVVQQPPHLWRRKVEALSKNEGPCARHRSVLYHNNVPNQNGSAHRYLRYTGRQIIAISSNNRTNWVSFSFSKLFSNNFLHKKI